MMRKGFWSFLMLVAVVAATSASLAAARPARTVAVPRVMGTEISAAYARLHRAGLRVSIRKGFGFQFLHKGHLIFPRVVVHMTPKPGRLVAPRSVITITVRCQCQPGHTREPRHKPSYQVPALAGRPALAAYTWVRTKILVFIAHLGPLHAGNARTLFGNYFTTRQSPGAFTYLRYSNRDGGWTPLSIWAGQTPHHGA
jgi:hypothetical protein